MKSYLKVGLAAICLLGLSDAALGQSKSVQQSGTVTGTHAPFWVANGIIADAGTSDVPAISTLGVYGTGTPFCVNNTKLHTATYYKLCMGYSTGSAAAEISLTPFGGASNIPLNLIINGSTYSIGGTNWLSGLLDSQFGSTQGSILFRNATVWTVLTPGTAGNLLATGGAAANPSWVAGTSLGTLTANTFLANTTGSTAVPIANALPSCATTASALLYTTNTGLSCNTTINAATLNGNTFASPGSIGATTPGAVTATTVVGNTSVSSPTVTGTTTVQFGASPGNARSFTSGGSTAYDTGLSVNANQRGNSMLASCSGQNNTGNFTNAGLYMLRFHYDGNAVPTATTISYDAGATGLGTYTFGVSGSNTLTITPGGNMNWGCALISNN